MKRKYMFPAILATGAFIAAAFDIVWLNTDAGLNIGVTVSDNTNIAFSSDKTQVEVTQGDALVGAVPASELQNLKFGQSDGNIAVRFADSGTCVEYPGYFESQDFSFEIDKATGVVIARQINDAAESLNLTVTGSIACGQMKVYATAPLALTLDNVDIANSDGSAINLQTKSPVEIILVGKSAVCDSKDYNSTPAGEKEKATIYSCSDLTFSGEGMVEVTGKNKHAICSEGKIEINSGAVSVLKSKSDGIHCSEFVMNAGKYVSSETKGDGIDADKGIATINGGNIDITLSQPDTKGITADTAISIIDGNVKIAIDSDQSKGIRTKGDFSIEGGHCEIVMTGNAVVVDGDPSYCTAVKNDGAFLLNGGEIVISSTGQGVRGISSQGIATFNSGKADISISCKSATYTDIEGEQDIYSGTCVSCDSTIIVNGGEISLTLAAEAGKGLKSDYDVIFNGGQLTAVATGDVYVLNGDPSYCAVIKSDDDFKMNDGSIVITHSGKGGKGISSNGKTTINNGAVEITCTGDGVVYTDESGNNDTATPACITSDKKVTLAGGTFTLKNSGSAGKCVKGDKKIEIGAEGAEGPTIYAETSGLRVKESSGSQGGQGGRPGGWGPGGGGWDQNGDYANPKCFKADDELIVYSGNITLKGSTEGGEGLESKTALTINGGNIDIQTVDDCINAANSITINGGFIHCKASNNDGIDSNGTITINGGTVVTIGAKSPEEGFDCDNNTFKITGGTLIGFGGGTSTPTSSVCTQRVVLFSANFTSGTVYTVCNPNGEQVISFKTPSSINGVMLISSAGIVNNGTYKIYSGGTLQGGDVFNEMTTGAQYTPGTQLKTFSPSSMVTSVR